ncbi:MAG: hypothetical protein N4A72_10855 [Bacteroidales bacterium]|jgi:hypothetical protein|nr:hypothetical protein [Bacteroidales bacterium]
MSKTTEQIYRVIRDIASDDEEMIFSGTVAEVLEEEQAITVKINEDIEIPNVLLRSLSGKNTGLVAFPKLESHVVCAKSLQHDFSYVIMYSDIDKMEYTGENMNWMFSDVDKTLLFVNGEVQSEITDTSINVTNKDVSIAIADNQITVTNGKASVEIKDDTIVMNEGGNDGLVVIGSLTEKLNGLVKEVDAIGKDVNDLKKGIGKWVAKANDGGASLKLALTSWFGKQIAATTKFSKPDYENQKVKH